MQNYKKDTIVVSRDALCDKALNLIETQGFPVVIADDIKGVEHQNKKVRLSLSSAVKADVAADPDEASGAQIVPSGAHRGCLPPLGAQSEPSEASKETDQNADPNAVIQKTGETKPLFTPSSAFFSSGSMGNGKFMQAAVALSTLSGPTVTMPADKGVGASVAAETNSASAHVPVSAEAFTVPTNADAPAAAETPKSAVMTTAVTGLAATTHAPVATKPNPPKKPPTAYLLFSASIRAGLKEQNPGATLGSLAKISGAMWADMEKSDKAPFVSQAEAAQRSYTDAMKAYVEQHGPVLAKVNKRKQEEAQLGDENM